MQNGLHGTKFLARLPWWSSSTTPRYSSCIHLNCSLRGAVELLRYTTMVFSIPLGSPMEWQSNRWIKKKNRIGSMDNSCFTWSEEQESCTIIEWYKKNTPASSDVSYVWCFVYDGGGCRGVRALTVDLKFEDERKIMWTQDSLKTRHFSIKSSQNICIFDYYRLTCLYIGLLSQRKYDNYLFVCFPMYLRILNRIKSLNVWILFSNIPQTSLTNIISRLICWHSPSSQQSSQNGKWTVSLLQKSRIRSTRKMRK